jgi:hypothetical protein
MNQKTVFASFDKEEVQEDGGDYSLFMREIQYMVPKQVYYLLFFQLLKLSQLLPVGYFLDRIYNKSKAYS